MHGGAPGGMSSVQTFKLDHLTMLTYVQDHLHIPSPHPRSHYGRLRLLSVHLGGEPPKLTIPLLDAHKLAWCGRPNVTLRCL